MISGEISIGNASLDYFEVLQQAGVSLYPYAASECGKMKGVGFVEKLIEYKSELNGRSYTCLYKLVYSQFRGCYTMPLVP